MRRVVLISLTIATCCVPRIGRANIVDLLNVLRPVQPAPRTLSQSPPRKLLFNGFPLQVMSGRTPESVDAVLDYYQENFARRSEGKQTQPMLRQRGTDFGSLVTSDTSLLDALKAMRATKQHYALTAPLRMAYAQKVDGYTDYLASWSDAPLPQTVLAPPVGQDAPGVDVPDTPRPPSSYRSFSLYEPAQGSRVVTYVCAFPPDLALSGTVALLRSAGYAPDPGFAQAANAKGRNMVRMERPGRDLLISVKAQRDRTDSTLVTYLSRDR